MGALILVASAALTALADGSLDHWLLSTTLTAERLLPLVGLGLVLGQCPQTRLKPAILLLLAGFVGGYFGHQPLMRLLAPLPAAPTHYFLVGPMACLLTGALLALSPAMRFRPGVFLLPVIGASLALAIRLSDPSLHDWRYPPLAMLLSVWLVFAIAGLARLVNAPWSLIAARVFGSWLLAIGALYGGAYMAAKTVELTPPPFVQPVRGSGDYPGFGAVLDAFEPAAGEGQ